MSARTGVAVAQFAPGADPDGNLAVMRRLAEQAVERVAGLVVFPEYSSFFTPEIGPVWVEAAQAVDGPFATGLAALARELGIIVVAGIVERGESADKFRNTAVAFGIDGSLLAISRKLHLYDAFGASESRWAEAGVLDEPQIFDFAELRVGIQTCYDLRFPEVTRRLVDAGADLVLVPSEWVRGPQKEHHWRILVTARALENTIYVAAADHTSPIGVGCSMIVDPMGVAMAALGEREDVGVAFPTAARLAEVRRLNPAVRLRRFQVVPR